MLKCGVVCNSVFDLRIVRPCLSLFHRSVYGHVIIARRFHEEKRFISQGHDATAIFWQGFYSFRLSRVSQSALFDSSCSDHFNGNVFADSSRLFFIKHSRLLCYECLNNSCCHSENGFCREEGNNSTCVVVVFFSSGPLQRTHLFWMSVVCPLHASSQNPHSSAPREHPAVRTTEQQI